MTSLGGITCNCGDDVPVPFHRLAPPRRASDALCPRTLRDGQRACAVRMRQRRGLVLDTTGGRPASASTPSRPEPFPARYCGAAAARRADRPATARTTRSPRVAKSTASRGPARGPSPASRGRMATASVAFTYNAGIFHEYAARHRRRPAARRGGKRWRCAGYICDAPRAEFLAMDAANIDLKGFTERFYRKHRLGIGRCWSRLYAVHETDCWVELTTLLIPGGDAELEEMRNAAAPTCRCISPPSTPTIGCFLTRAPRWRPCAARAVYIGAGRGRRVDASGATPITARASTYCSGCGKPGDRARWHELSWRVDASGAHAMRRPCPASSPGAGPGGPRASRCPSTLGFCA